MQSTIPWRNFKPHFEYSDKQIINSQFNKFGIYNPVEVLKTINAFGFANLSPEILVPIENIFIKSQKIDSI
ncbi:MAG: hypothetical protein MJ219_00435 [Mycoplasmoidaceae bacterium]|nr:hypothetical protein [Mycoplasmoidaceae bacterium]